MAETVVLSAAERRQSLSVAIACITVFGITVAVTSPLISLILEARGVSGTVIGAMAAVPAVSLLLTNPLIPLAVRKVGLRRFLYSCIALQLVLTLLMPVFDHIVAWFILRALAGAAVNGLFVASETWINLVAEERSRGRVLAFYGMALSASFAAGPLLITVTGIEGPLPFCVIAGTIFLAGLPLFMARGLSPVVQGTASFGVFSFILVAPALTAAVFLSAFKEMSIGALLPVFGVRSGLTRDEAATLLSAGYLGAFALQYPIGWVADRINRQLLLLILMVVGVAGSFALPSVMERLDFVIWIYVALWVGLFSGIYIVVMAIVGQRYRGGDLVTANSCFGLLWGLGSLTGPSLSGISMDIWDPNGFPGLIGVVAGLVLILVVVFRRR